MSNIPDVKPISPHLLQELLEQDIISQATYNTAMEFLPKPKWQNWLQHMLLLLGTALLLAGVIFFFAYNWADMLPRYKFIVIQAAILLSAGLSHYLGVDKLSGQTCLSGCVILIGVLMAVFGQVYQTGADSYELFMGWAILTIGLALYGRFTGLWLIWLIIATTGMILFWAQVAEPVYGTSPEACGLAVVGLHTVALICFEFGFQHGLSWLKPRWLPALLLTTIFITLTVPVFTLIFEFQRSQTITHITGLIWVVAIAASYLWYRFRQPDFIALFLMASTACIVITTLTCKLIYEFIFRGSMGDGIFLLNGMIVLACFGCTALWLKKLHVTLHREEQS